MPFFRQFLRVSRDEVSFPKRGFPDDGTGVREHLERAGGAFVDGYNSALQHDSRPSLVDAIEAMPRDLRGFAYEGASMALALLDLLTPWKRVRWRALLECASQHIYLCVVGTGWSLARLRMRSIPEFIREADPLLAPLAADGFGFHEAFFRTARVVRDVAPPPLRGMDAHGYDQGVGRALWFVEAASPERIANTIARFSPQRQADLWSGAGLALGYAGGIDGETARRLLEKAGPHRGNAAQGIAFAAKARVLAGNITDATELACDIAWNRDAAVTARLVDDVLTTCATEPVSSRYEAWRHLLIAMGRESGLAVTP